MEILNAIILLSTALPLIGTAITFIAKFIKSDKAKRTAEAFIKINAAIEEFMVKAEKLKDYTGNEKKNYVLRCVKNFALSNEIEFDEINADETIEKLIGFSKNVNKEEFCPEPPAITQKIRIGKKSIVEEGSKANKNDIAKKKTNKTNKNQGEKGNE